MYYNKLNNDLQAEKYMQGSETPQKYFHELPHMRPEAQFFIPFYVQFLACRYDQENAAPVSLGPCGASEQVMKNPEPHRGQAKRKMSKSLFAPLPCPLGLVVLLNK